MKNEMVLEVNRKKLKEALEKKLKPGMPYALVDFPDHSNIGDIAIWLGEILLLKEITGLFPSYVASIKDFSKDDLRTFLPEGAILIHGGGNFGDLYPHHHGLREHICSNFADRTIIQLPQSLYFSEESAFDESRRHFKSCKDLTIYTRDWNSYELAQRFHDGDVILSPDSAFALEIKPTKLPKNDVFFLLRKDTESNNHSFDFGRTKMTYAIDDWLNYSGKLGNKFKLLNAYKLANTAFSNPMTKRLAFYNVFANKLLSRGVSLLSSGTVVCTDRLHGHILCTLLGITHVVLDNRYGKVSSFIDVWTDSSDLLYRADNMDQAIDTLKGLLAKQS